MNAYFYERCGVSSVDLAYPSNFDMFGGLDRETPFIIYKYPIATMINYTPLDSPGQLESLELNPLSTWGKLYSSAELSMHSCFYKWLKLALS